jgi:hypothetical protein
MSDPSGKVHKAQAIDASWAEDPLNYMVKAFIAFLQTIFEKAPIGYFHWSPQLEDAEIIITEENPIALDTVGQRPAISVVLGAVEWNASSMDEYLGSNPQTGTSKHTDLLPGMMSLNCCSRNGTEARFLAWQCGRHIWNLRRIFMQEPFIHEIGRRIRIGPVTPAGAIVQGDTEGEWRAASVSCPFYLQWFEQITPITDWNGKEMQPLREIEATYRTRMTMAQENLTHEQNAGRRLWGSMVTQPKPPRAPRMRGRTIQQVEPELSSVPLVVKTKVS